MSSIRPLITITIILVAGAYLFMKINEAPVAPAPGAASPWQSAAEVPPLAATVGNPSSAGSDAPAWPSANSATGVTDGGPGATGFNPTAPAAVDVATAETLPAVPAIPDLPDMPSSDGAGPTTAAPTASFPATLPANIPTAQYPDQPGISAAAGSTDPFASPTSTTATAATQQIPAAPNATAEANSPLTGQLPAAPPFQTAEAPAPLNPLRQTAPPQTAIDPYAPIGTTQAQTTPEASPPAEASLAASWPEIQTALDRGELATAHKLLSKWYDDPSLTPTDAQRVETLLSQLAGTVVYSTEHQLEPAYIVRPGETLETIAKEHNVPWQLLAKINGIAAAGQVQSGQQLKVVPGPFSAVVDLRRSQLTLMVDGCYAGKFPVTVATGTMVAEGEWVVEDKPVAPSTSPAAPGAAATAGAVDRAIVLRGQSAGGTAATGPTLSIAGGSSTGIAASASPAIKISPADAEELSDILSIGSRVIIRR